MRDELAGCRAAAGGDEGRGIAHQTPLAALDGDEHREIGQYGAIENSPRETTPAAIIAALPAEDPKVV